MTSTDAMTDAHRGPAVAAHSAAPSAGPAHRGWRPPAPMVALAVLLGVELAAVSLVYNHAFDFACEAVAPRWFCLGMSLAVLRALGAGAAAAIVLVARRAALARLVGALRPRLDRGWLALHLIGAGLIFAPWLFVADGVTPGVFAVAVSIWLSGAALAGLGALLALAPAPALAALARAAGPALLVAVAVGAFAPEIGIAAQRGWAGSPLTGPTFAVVAAVLEVLSASVSVDAPALLIGVDDFVVEVASGCSGVEGFALITGFTALYLVLFRDQLSFPVALILLPVGLLLSWCLNVLRITALVLLGAHVSPDLAVTAFHSHAGWLMFTLLSLSMVTVAHRIPALRRRAPATGPAAAAAPGSATAGAMPRAPFSTEGLSADALMLPFIALMAGSLLTSTFSTDPALLYPLKIAAAALAIWAFRDAFLRLVWRLDAFAVGGGVAVGALWIAVYGGGDGAPVELVGAAWVAWAAVRIAGTVLVAPLVEEVFFRGYVERRLAVGGAPAWAAVAVSAALFAALHGKWEAALVASVLFSLAMRRNGRLSDAVVAHAAANVTVALWAATTGDWSVI